MKGLYMLSGMMVVGLLVMFVSYYKLLTELGTARAGSIAQPGVQTYVAINYFGLALFLIGAVGALFLLLRSLTRRG
jgi:hypothetical protein